MNRIHGKYVGENPKRINIIFFDDDNKNVETVRSYTSEKLSDIIRRLLKKEAEKLEKKGEKNS